jgi:acetylglutamate kinase
MNTLIAKAGVLIEALPYIQRFRDAIIVVKFGGSTMDQRSQFEGILTDVTFMECIGMKPVIVHGGGKAISRAMEAAGLKAHFVRGLRVTDAAAIGVVKEVIRHQINRDIVTTLRSQGAAARTIDGTDVFLVEKRIGRDETTGATLDWGFVGDIVEVDPEPLEVYLKANVIPVVTPLGRGRDGQTYNLNADDAAAAVAKALKARKLAFLSDIPGLLRDRNDESTLLSTLHIREVAQMIEQKIIDGGMLPKIRSCMEALSAGVKKIHIIDGRLPHSLLLEIFTDKGVGTEIIE